MSQLAHSEEKVFTFPIMAGLQTYHSFYYNPPLGGKNKLIEIASTKKSNIYILILSLLHIFISALALAPLSTNELFQQFMKAYLKAQT